MLLEEMDKDFFQCFVCLPSTLNRHGIMRLVWQRCLRVVTGYNVREHTRYLAQLTVYGRATVTSTPNPGAWALGVVRGLQHASDDGQVGIVARVTARFYRAPRRRISIGVIR